MTATTTIGSAPPREDLGAARITTVGLLRSKWTKLWSVRQLQITLAAAFALITGLSSCMIVDGQALCSDDGAGDVPFGWTAIYPVGMLVLVILGVLTITSEYSTASILPSVVAAPRRTGVFLAKAAVLTAVTTALVS